MPKRRPPANLEFKIIPVEEIPLRKPIVYPPEDQRGSEYDRILAALTCNPGRAVKITSRDSVPLSALTAKKRRGIKSGLITIGKNGRLPKLSTQVAFDAVYAFVEEE